MPVTHAPDQPVLKVENLGVVYETRKGSILVVRDVSFNIHDGETLGIVGESGCGKSTVAFAIVNFLGRNGRLVDGHILFQGQDLVARSSEELRRLRGNRIAMVYQDPAQALNPSLTLGDQMAEVLIVHRNMTRRVAEERCLQMLERVRIPDPVSVMRRYPHQVSGGQQQRVVIAMALLNAPSLLILDEPTTALDVTVEADVLDLIREMQREISTAVMYISHNLGVVARVSDRIAVMYAGELVEQATVEDVYLRPHHPYTQGLMRSAPKLGQDKTSSYLQPIPGRVPPPSKLPRGCTFEPRCGHAQTRCSLERPEFREVARDHVSKCFFAEEVGRANWRRAEEGIPARETPGRMGPATPLILRVEHVAKYYPISSNRLLGGKKQYVRAVDGVSFQLFAGRSLGIVGESGCGKSTLVRTIIGLEKPTAGRLEFMGVDIAMPISERNLDLIRNLQMVFQNPDSTLNPSFSVGRQIGRALRRFKRLPRSQVRQEVIHLLRLMKLGEAYHDRLPRQLSGGERQRVAIARAIAGQPKLLLCDEPLSALDVSVQAAVLSLLLDIQRRAETTIVLIAHDLSVVRFFCDEIAVMYLGQFCEVGQAEDIYSPPYHPYTESLLAAVPVPDPRVKQRRIRLSGPVPSALNPPSGCLFHTRCPRKVGSICERESPPVREVKPGHFIRCHIPIEDLEKTEMVVTMSGDVWGHQPASRCG